MSWIPGWQSIEGTAFWSGVYFWASIGSLILLGVTEVASHKYSLRNEQLVQQQQRDRQRQHDSEIADLNLKASTADQNAAEYEKEAAGLSLRLAEIQKHGQKLDNRITSFSVGIVVDFSWPIDAKPLLDNGADSGSANLQLQLLSPRGFFYLNPISGYSISRTGPNTAKYQATFSPASGQSPLGEQIESIASIQDIITNVTLVGYQPGRDSYPITIARSAIILRVNERKARLVSDEERSAIPVRIDDHIYGAFPVHTHIEGGIGSRLQVTDGPEENNQSKE